MHALSFFPNSLFQLVTKEQKRNKPDPHQMVFSLTRSLPIVLIFCFRTHTQTRNRTLALTKLENDYGVVGNRRFSLRFPSLEGYWNEMQTFLRSINTLSTLCVIGWIFFSLSLKRPEKMFLKNAFQPWIFEFPRLQRTNALLGACFVSSWLLLCARPFLRGHFFTKHTPSLSFHWGTKKKLNHNPPHTRTLCSLREVAFAAVVCFSAYYHRIYAWN